MSEMDTIPRINVELTVGEMLVLHRILEMWKAGREQPNLWGLTAPVPARVVSALAKLRDRLKFKYDERGHQRFVLGTHCNGRLCAIGDERRRCTCDCPRCPPVRAREAQEQACLDGDPT
jgi:hypothetical protein